MSDDLEAAKRQSVENGFKKGQIASESLTSAASKMRSPGMDAGVATQFEGIVSKLHTASELKGLHNGGYDVRDMVGHAVSKAMVGEVSPKPNTTGTTLTTIVPNLMKHTDLHVTNPVLFGEIAGFSASLAAVAPKPAAAPKVSAAPAAPAVQRRMGMAS